MVNEKDARMPVVVWSQEETEVRDCENSLML